MSDTNENQTNADLVTLTADVAASYLSNNHVQTDQIGPLMQAIHASLAALGTSEVSVAAAPEVEYTPAVSVRKSITKDHLISMIDGKPYRTLKRHLTTNGLTPSEYRERYNLKADYPMVAESYSASRSEMAKKIGLGQKRAAKAAADKADTTAKKTAKPRATKKSEEKVAEAA